MVAVDTNILLNAVNADSPLHDACAATVEAMVNGSQPVALAWPVVYEFLRVATHPKVFRRPLTFDEAWGQLAELLASPGCKILRETAAHAAELARCAAEAPRLSGNLLHDFHLAVLMREHGITEVLTLDRDFRAFPWVTCRGV